MPPNRERPDWQAVWERLRKLGLEFDNDRCNGIVEAHKRLHNPLPIGWRPFLERYIKGEVGLHVHFEQRRSALPDLADTAKFCATFEWPRGTLLHDSELDFWHQGAHRVRGERLDASDIVKPDEEADQMKVAVLVGVPEFMENRERFRSGGFPRMLPCDKRLQCLEVCAQTWPDSPEAIRWLNRPRLARTGIFRETGREGVVDREGDILPSSPGSLPRNGVGGRSLFGNGELPNEMVERGAEIVDHIPDDGSQFLNRWLPKGFTVDDYLSSWDIRLGFDFVRATVRDKRLDSFVEEFQMHFRPTYLRPTSAEVGLVGHDLEDSKE